MLKSKQPDFKPYVTRSDAEYDGIEDRYRKLCAEEGVSPTACDMVDVDLERPSVRLVLSLLANPRQSGWAPLKLS